jgi:hypothetical protein
MDQRLAQFFDFSLTDDEIRELLSGDALEFLIVLRNHIRQSIELMSPAGRRLMLGQLVLSGTRKILEKGASAKEVLRAIEILERVDMSSARSAIPVIDVETKGVTPSLIDEQFEKIRQLGVNDVRVGENSETPSAQSVEG